MTNIVFEDFVGPGQSSWGWFAGKAKISFCEFARIDSTHRNVQAAIIAVKSRGALPDSSRRKKLGS